MRSLIEETYFLLLFQFFLDHLWSAFKNTCLDDAAAVDDKEGVEGEVGAGVQHSKAARHLRFFQQVFLEANLGTSPVLSASMIMGPPPSLLSLHTLTNLK